MNTNRTIRLLVVAAVLLALCIVASVISAQAQVEEYPWPEFCITEPHILWPEVEAEGFCRMTDYGALWFKRAGCETGLPIPEHYEFFYFPAQECRLPDSPELPVMPDQPGEMDDPLPPPLVQYSLYVPAVEWNCPIGWQWIGDQCIRIEP